MEQKLLWMTVVLVLAGTYFIGSGVTGNIISQSCCFPPNCAEENICESARPHIESPARSFNDSLIYLGLIAMSCSIGIFFLHKHEHLK
ncbi:hypothetical protein H8D36_03795 [archaeon]|nr:hypothetical protein [archaeon]MBL7056950.1 hypothetical protein [Candidatus Woesearchaeota archaeon]